jgi:uncharacterized protein YjiS (DUF1127 family)
VTICRPQAGYDPAGAGRKEFGAMDILHRLSTARAAAGREGLIYHALARLDARALADLGVDRAEIRGVARLGARSGPGGVDLREVLAQVRAGQADATSEPLTGLAAIAADLWRAAAASDLGRSIQLRLLWRRAFRQVRAELRSYSPRELMTDLRLSPAEIDDTAAVSADERVAAFVAANPAFRRAALPRRAAA